MTGEFDLLQKKDFIKNWVPSTLVMGIENCIAFNKFY